MIHFPDINPIILSIGPLAISWYSLAYICGILFGWFYATKLVLIHPIGINKKHIEDFIGWIIIAIIIGGRIGYIFFYNSEKYLLCPVEILKIYKGGMSFHGGISAVTLTSYLFCRKNNLRFLSITDILSIVSPIGILLGRLANFINAELYGRPTNVPWAIIFPYSDGLLRHPSQLYEAFLEGAVLLLIMMYSVYNCKSLINPGKTSGIFLIFYAIFRTFVEFFREPDVKIGFIMKYFTLGQLLCVPMFVIGVYLLNYSSRDMIQDDNR